MADRKYQILFLCTGNSARSILAEGIMHKMNDPRFEAHSAGSQPKGEVHPYAIDLLGLEGIDAGFARSKSWDEFASGDQPEMDFIFTVCDQAAAETCPVWPGHPMTAHWGVPDPAAASGTEAEVRQAFLDAYRMLNTRISLFANLPIESIDRLSLHTRLGEIGKS